VEPWQALVNIMAVLKLAVFVMLEAALGALVAPVA